MPSPVTAMRLSIASKASQMGQKRSTLRYGFGSALNFGQMIPDAGREDDIAAMQQLIIRAKGKSPVTEGDARYVGMVNLRAKNSAPALEARLDTPYCGSPPRSRECYGSSVSTELAIGHALALCSGAGIVPNKLPQ